MEQPNMELIRAMTAAAEKAQKGLSSGAALILRGFDKQQKEFEVKKRELEDDIKRGARISKGHIPY